MRLLFFIFLISALISCEKEDTFSLNYNTTNKGVIYLFKFQKNKPIKIDSSSSNLKHSFKIKAPFSELFLIGPSIDKSVLFIAENRLKNTIVLEDSNYYDINIKGDSTNIILQEYFKQKNKVILQLQEINNSDNFDKQKESEKIISNHIDFVHDFIRKNSKSPAILMLLGEVNNPLEFKDELLMIKEVVETKYKNNDFLKEINKIIQAGKQQEQLITQQKIREQQEISQNKILGINIGDIAPEINLKNPDGKRIKLSSLKNKVVLLDFWASWCRPCRGENPNLVRLYNKFKSKGFTVYSVSMDKSKDKWTEAILQDNLTWENHVSELQGWNSSAGNKYGVTSIPKTFLINKQGEIVGFNLRGESLEKKINELLAS